MKSKLKYPKPVIIAVVIAAVFVAGAIGFRVYKAMMRHSDPGASIPRQNNGQIFLYGEEHSKETILQKELELWDAFYHNDNMRDLFVELPFYTAEFLNLWMFSDNDDILYQLYQDWDGTAIHSEAILDFYKQIKSDCPKTVFHGTDVGHQYGTTGKRYLKYLLENGFNENSEAYRLTEENIGQGKYYYRHSDYAYRENKMTENFIREFERLSNTNVMGIYGSAHTEIVKIDYVTNSVPSLATRLKERYGDSLHTKDLRLIDEPYTIGTVQINDKEYTASFFGKVDLSTVFPEYQSREFWRIENAYDDFKDCPVTGNVLPYNNYPMQIEVGQIFVIIYTKSDGTVKKEYYRADGNLWKGVYVTEEFTI